MYSVEEARDVLLAHSKVITKTKYLPLLSCLGRVLAEDAKAVYDQPPFPRSPLDGYALRGEETNGASKESPKQFRVIGKIYAGQCFDGKVGAGEAVRIMTGAPIPEGANTVIRQEWTDFGEDVVEIYGQSKPFSDYCPQGEDYQAGDVLIKKGSVIDGTSIAILASLGYAQCLVYEAPRVGIISTGDEVIEPGSSMIPGKIYDSNLNYICARLLEKGCQPVFAIHAQDDPANVSEIIQKYAPDCDLIITTGGVSVGEKDIMHEVQEFVATKKLFWRVNIKPGAPTLSFLCGQTPVVCLSGNPFGAVANFELLIRPILYKMTGNPVWNMPVLHMEIQNDFKKGRCRRFLRAHYENDKVWLPEGNHASGAISSMLGCNCFVEIPEAAEKGVKKGDIVGVHLL